MAFNTEWKDCGRHISEYNLTKLPRGTETEHKDFRADRNKLPGASQHRGGWSKKQTEEEIQAEAAAMMEAREAKLLQEDEK